jgi:putative tryptophan/tyrosine transport system substrate-binding protein
MATAADPVRAGIVASLAHPGGNITLYGSELSSKRVEVFKEVVPGIAQYSCEDQPVFVRRYATRDSRAGDRTAALHRAGTNELAAAFAAMQRNGADAMIVFSDSMFNSWRRQSNVLAAEHRLPAMYEAREHAEDGGLISYGPNIAETTRRSAALVGKVLNGVKPSDLSRAADKIRAGDQS